MFNKFRLMFNKRPEIDSQNTGRDAYQQYQSYALAGVNGNGGQGVRRTIRAFNPGTIAVGPTHKLNDPTVTGNVNTTVDLQPLSQESGVISGAQF